MRRFRVLMDGRRRLSESDVRSSDPGPTRSSNCHDTQAKFIFNQLEAARAAPGAPSALPGQAAAQARRPGRRRPSGTLGHCDIACDITLHNCDIRVTCDIKLHHVI